MRFPHVNRRAACLGGLAAGALAVGRAGAAPDPDVTYLEDFDELWRTLGERYCFFADKQTDWAKVGRLYRPQARAAQDDAAFTDVVRRVLNELYDAHTHLSDPPDGAPRWPLYDLLMARHRGMAQIAAVQEGSAAADAGLKAGDVVLQIDGRPVEAVVADRAPKCLRRPDPAADLYALNVALAGHVAQGRTLRVRAAAGAGERLVDLPVKPRAPRPDLESRRLSGGIGYIAIRTFADKAVVEAFDKALAGLRDAPALILDVRGNGGGDTAVARPIMGRFISAPRAYALMRRRAGAGLSAPWTETVEPRGPFTFDRPVVVLADHWSGSMAEGFPMGMRDIGRGVIVGTPMMGLGAAVFPIRLDRTGLQAQYSGEPVYDTHRRPRWRLTPDMPVTDGADILDAGLAVARRLASADHKATG